MACQGDCQCKNDGVENNYSSDNGSINDDIWEADNSENIIPNRDIIRAHHKQGYVDGMTHAKEAALQKGFDDAYTEGAKLAISVGKILANLKNQSTKNHDSELFTQAKSELHITKVLQKKYFNDDLELEVGKSHELIAEWEQKAN
ncbi:YAE1 Protein YAE1 [Candida maltosa Xu316]